MKKRKVLYGLTALLLLGAPLGALASCGGDDTIDPTPGPDDNPDVDDDEIVSFEAKFSFNEGVDSLTIGESVNIICSNAKNGKGEVVEGVEYSYTVKDENVVSVSASGTVTGLNTGETTIEITCRNASDKLTPVTLTIKVSGEAPIASGGHSFVSSANPYQDKLEILGKLEKYAVEEHLTGITLFQNGGYVMYNDRIKKPTNNYITGYGFGILTEGEITKDMDKETNTAWKRYYHTFGGTANKQKFNYLDDTGSESADLYGYITSSYYGTKMNANKDGYEWYPLLAKNAKEAGMSTEEIGNFDPNRPIPLNYNEGTGLATKYKIYVKTGAKDGVKYSTLSTIPGVKDAFDGKDIELEDYVTPYKLLLNKKMDLARSTDFISDTSDGTLRGAKAFYNSCNTSNLDDETLYGKDGKSGLFRALVGIETNEEENSIVFTFNNPITPFDAMVNLSGSLNSPIPQGFLKLIAPDKSTANLYKSAMNEAYGTAIKNTKYTPRDTTLSCGPYVVEETDSQNNVFKRNERYLEVKEGRYKIPGIKIQYFQGAASDKNFTFNKFIEDGILDAVSIPKDFMDQYKDDPRTTTTQGDSTFKLNLNTFTQKEWDNNKAFKENGSGTSYKCKSLMSNDNFINALSFALDRETFATSRGSVPSQSYFAPAYLWEPEQGLSYDETDQHKAVIAEYSPETYGYNESIAVQLFDKAIEEEVNKGNYTFKSSETININWMNPTDTDEYGKEIVGYFNKAFEKTNAYKKGFRINFENINGSTDYQHVYDIMKKGTFDIAFGSVSGMQLDPLGFLEVVKSNNVTGFTTNWGTDTSKISEENPIIYQGQRWSFDGLWDAANKGAIIKSDGTVEDEPVKAISNAAAPEDRKVDFIKEDGSKININVKQLAINIQVASSTTFKMFASDKEELRSEEFVTLVIDYKDGETTKSAAMNLYYGKGLFSIRDKNDIDQITGNNAYIVLNIPSVLDSNTTDGQIGNTIEFAKISKITAYVNCYMVINNVPTTSQVSTVLRLK